MFYDAMISKLCSYGKTRDEAIKHMRSALGQFAIGGVSHNISFLETIMQNERFIKGNLSTSFIKDEFPSGFAGNELDSEAKKVLISSALFIFFKNFVRNGKITGKLENRQKQISDRWVVMIDEQSYLVDVLEKDTDKYKFLCD